MQFSPVAYLFEGAIGCSRCVQESPAASAFEQASVVKIYAHEQDVDALECDICLKGVI